MRKFRKASFWGRLATCGLDRIHVSHDLLQANQRLLTGGVWANIELAYDDTMTDNRAIRPCVLRRFAPIQIASAGLQESSRHVRASHVMSGSTGSRDRLATG
jgi:ATP-dependent Lon protease